MSFRAYELLDCLRAVVVLDATAASDTTVARAVLMVNVRQVAASLIGEGA